MEDTERYVRYFKYNGTDPGHNVFVGEVEPEAVYEIVNPEVVSILAGHSDWREVNRANFDRQSAKTQGGS